MGREEERKVETPGPLTKGKLKKDKTQPVTFYGVVVVLTEHKDKSEADDALVKKIYRYNP